MGGKNARLSEESRRITCLESFIYSISFQNCFRTYTFSVFVWISSGCSGCLCFAIAHLLADLTQIQSVNHVKWRFQRRGVSGKSPGDTNDTWNFTRNPSTRTSTWLEAAMFRQQANTDYPETPQYTHHVQPPIFSPASQSRPLGRKMRQVTSKFEDFFMTSLKPYAPQLLTSRTDDWS